MKFELKHRWTRQIMLTLDAQTIKEAVQRAALQGAALQDADLRGADLRGAALRGAALGGADLRGADLRGAVLRGAALGDADLRGADLQGADLQDAVLRGASLGGADLRGADLHGADLRGADLQDADLRGTDLQGAVLRGAALQDADLRGAALRGAALRGADLRGADLTPIRDDLWAVLSACPKEVEGLRCALIEGRVDGSLYVGDCACLLGTSANLRGCESHQLARAKPDVNRPAERLFLMIASGQTPETHLPSKIAVEWIDQWLVNMRDAFGICGGPGPVPGDSEKKLPDQAST